MRGHSSLAEHALDRNNWTINEFVVIVYFELIMDFDYLVYRPKATDGIVNVYAAVCYRLSNSMRCSMLNGSFVSVVCACMLRLTTSTLASLLLFLFFCCCCLHAIAMFYLISDLTLGSLCDEKWKREWKRQIERELRSTTVNFAIECKRALYRFSGGELK